MTHHLTHQSAGTQAKGLEGVTSGSVVNASLSLETEVVGGCAKLNQSTQSMKKILVEKNSQVKELRKRLMMFDPTCAASVGGDEVEAVHSHEIP